MRYLRWGGDGEAVQPEKGYGIENCLKCVQNPQRQVHALLGVFLGSLHFKCKELIAIIKIHNQNITTNY